MKQPHSGYWAKVASQSAHAIAVPLWRDYCDQLHSALIRDWTGSRHFRSALKTDLFDEAMGRGLVPVILEDADTLHGIDLAAEIVERAFAAYPRLLASVADVRRLSFADGSMDLIVSNSTLDHFQSVEDLDRSLEELRRVLAPGGLLLVTLDNPRNPIVALRNRLPKSLLGRSSLAPYFVGHTYSLTELEHALGRQGLQVVCARHLMHVPRVAFLHLCRLFRSGSLVGRTLLSCMLALERLSSWPTAPLTGHFVAVLACKPRMESPGMLDS
jgi:SAM-dependent methyltransferase